MPEMTLLANRAVRREACALPGFERAATVERVVRSSVREARLRAVVDAHIDFVARVLRNTGVTESEIDDAVQKTFIAMNHRLDDVREGAEKSFLLQTALHVAAHARRSAARKREIVMDELPDHPQDCASPEELTAQKHARLMLDRVLDSLDLDLRTVFVLYEFEEMSTAQIASSLGIPRGTVASRLRRARAEFRERVFEAEGHTKAKVGS